MQQFTPLLDNFFTSLTHTTKQDGNVTTFSAAPLNPEAQTALTFESTPGTKAEKVKESLERLKNTELHCINAPQIVATVKTRQRGKLVSPEARNKSLANGFSQDQHLALAARVDDLYKYAIPLGEYNDVNSDQNVKAIFRFAAPARIDGKIAFALLTLKRSEGNKLYSLELEEINQLGGTLDRLKHLLKEEPSTIPLRADGDIVAELAAKVKEYFGENALPAISATEASALFTNGTLQTENAITTQPGATFSIESTDSGSFSAEAVNTPLFSDAQAAKAELKKVQGKTFTNGEVRAVVSGQTIGKTHAAQMSVRNLTALGYSVDEARKLHYSACTKIHEIFESSPYGFFEPNYAPENKRGRAGAWHYFGVVNIDGYGEFDVNVSAIQTVKESDDNPLFTLELTIENPSGVSGDTLSQRGRALRSEGSSGGRLAAYRSFVEKEMAVIKKKAQKDGYFMLAPNGKPTKLTEPQWLQVRTQAFKNWFGDWENDPENASKAVDENGEPKVFYHHTNAEFTEFLHSEKGKTDAGWLGSGFYFYGIEDEGKGYGRNSMACFLNVREPYYAADEDMFRLSEADSIEESEAFTESLIEDGYDGVYYDGDLRQEMMVFEPNQIKSATDNRGTFDGSNPDVTFSIAAADNLRQHYAENPNGTPPEGWWVHGRRGQDNLNTEHVLQLTRRNEVGEQYAGSNGSVWYIRPKANAPILDTRNPEHIQQLRNFVKSELENYDSPIYSDYEHVLLDEKREEITDEDIDKILSHFIPQDIVNSAEAYDNPEWVQRLWNALEVGFIITPDGAVVLDPMAIEAVRVDEDAESPGEAQVSHSIAVADNLEQRFAGTPLAERMSFYLHREAKRFSRIIGNTTPYDTAVNAIASANAVISMLDKYVHTNKIPLGRNERNRLSLLQRQRTLPRTHTPSLQETIVYCRKHCHPIERQYTWDFICNVLEKQTSHLAAPKIMSRIFYPCIASRRLA